MSSLGEGHHAPARSTSACVHMSKPFCKSWLTTNVKVGPRAALAISWSKISTACGIQGPSTARQEHDVGVVDQGTGNGLRHAAREGAHHVEAAMSSTASKLRHTRLRRSPRHTASRTEAWFCSAVRSGYSMALCEISPIAARTIGFFLRIDAAISAEPAVGRASVDSMRNSVVFPSAVRAEMERNAPSGTSMKPCQRLARGHLSELFRSMAICPTGAPFPRPCLGSQTVAASLGQNRRPPRQPRLAHLFAASTLADSRSGIAWQSAVAPGCSVTLLGACATATQRGHARPPSAIAKPTHTSEMRRVDARPWRTRRRCSRRGTPRTSPRPAARDRSLATRSAAGFPTPAARRVNEPNL